MNIFLEVLLDQDKAGDCKKFLSEVQLGSKEAFISTFTIDAIALLLVRYKVSMGDVRKFLVGLLRYKGLVIYSVTMSDRLSCIGHCEKFGLDYEDALTLQAAVSAQSGEIVSFDKHFDSVSIVRRVEPSDILGG